MAKASYSDATEVKEIADELIEKYHRHLIDFDVKIEYLFVDKTPKKGDKEIWGTCRKFSGINAFMANSNDEPFFVITISKPVWDVLPPDKRIILVDHELCHAEAHENPKEGADDPVKRSIRPHDLEEFCCIVKRYGLWREDVEAFVKSAMSNSDET